MATINGTENEDVLSDTSENDTIDAQGGDDTVTVSEGGTDTVDGGEGNDRLVLDARVRGGAIDMPAPTQNSDGLSGSASWSGTSVSFQRIENFTIFSSRGNFADDVVTGGGDDVFVHYGINDRFYLLDTVDLGAGSNDLLVADFSAVTSFAVANSTTSDGRFLFTVDGGGKIVYSNVERIHFIGGAQGDNVTGQVGDDLLEGRGGNDTLNGGAGNDTIDGGSGDDTIRGQEGDDRLIVSGPGGETAEGGADTDTLVIQWGDATRRVQNNGGPAANTSLGGFNGQFTDFGTRHVNYNSIERFEITTGSGSDIITTATGDDIVNTGAGDDFVDTGSGNDTADGGEGVDSISANLSAVTGDINWNLQTNSYSGPVGTYTNFEYFGTVTTGSGNDTLVSTSLLKSETFNLGAGNDSATVVNGEDVVHGGAGNDTLVIDYSGTNRQVRNNGGPTANAAGGVDGQFNDFGGRSVGFTSIERFDITTGGGNDLITTGDGDDRVILGAGDDFTDVGGGINTADGGAGVDGLSVSFSAHASGVSIDLRNATNSGDFGSFTNFEYFGRVTGSAFSDSFTGTSALRDETFDLLDGDDSATVFNGFDTVLGGAGNDTLVIDYSGTNRQVRNNGGPAPNGTLGGFDGQFNDFGGRGVNYNSIERFDITTGGGNDIITTASGDDVVRTGVGDDFVNVGSGNDTADGGNSGVDATTGATIRGKDGISADLSAATSAINWDLQANTYSGPIGSFTNFEYFGTVTTGSGDDTVVSTSVLANDTINLGAGNDSATVVNGDDIVAGGAGTDTLVIDYSGTNRQVRNNGGPTSDGAGAFSGQFNDFGGRSVSFSGIERFDITTGGGNDIITTATGDDIVRTGVGDDLVDVSSGNDTADGGAGTDRISANLSAATGAIVFNLQANEYSGPFGSFTNFEYFGTLTTGSGDDTVVTTSVLANETINLGAGDDSVTVVNGDDTVAGGEGADTLVIDYSGTNRQVRNNGGPSSDGVGGFTGQFNDFGGRSVSFSGIERFDITTGGGNDLITTASGDDVVRTGVGDDFVNVGSGNDTADGGNSGVDATTGATIRGKDGISADLSAATSAINWDLQANTYSGPIGSFTNFEYFGTVTTGSGDDTVVTTSVLANETINLGAGNDSVTVVNGDDTVAGGEGADTLVIDYSGTNRQVRNNGGPSSDGLGGFTGQFNDFGGRSVSFSGIERFDITTGGGNDVITTGSGDDIVRTGAGDDVVNTGSGNDFADGGDGIDGISADLSAATNDVVLDLRNGISTGPFGNFINFEYFGTLRTGSGDDVIVTTTIAADETIITNGGDDTVTVFNGNDTVQGGEGFDTLIIDYSASARGFRNNGGPGANGALGGFDGQFNDFGGRSVSYSSIERFIITGSSGGDSITTATGNDQIRSGAGNDFVNAGAGNDFVDGGAGDDNLNGSLGNDTVSYQSATASVTVDLAITTAQNTGGGGTDTLSGFENITGSSSDDTLRGDVFDNVIDGGAGADTMAGRRGSDTYVVDNEGDVVIEEAGQGVDLVETDLASYTLTANVENLIGTGVGQSLTGNELNNGIVGTLGNDTLSGEAGDDVLVGLGGSDTLSGGEGRDILIAGVVDQTNLVVNGSFETQNGSNDSRAFIQAAPSDYNGVTFRFSDTLFGWQKNDPDSEQFELNTFGSNPDFDRGDGNVVLDLESDAGENLSIFQDIAGVPAGTELLLSFTASKPTGGSLGTDPTATLEVIWNGVVIATITPGSTAATQHAFVVTAAASGTGANGANRLEFREVGGGSDARGTQLDAVALRAIVPGTDAAGDTLNGGAGNDTLIGDAGNDTLDAGAGNDTVRAGAGDDTIRISSGNDTVDAGTGNDTIVIDYSAQTVSIRNGSTGEFSYTNGGDTSVTITGVERINITTGSGNDNITTGSGDDVITTNDGGDIINAGAGNDVINAGAGNDFVDAGTGGVDADGGAGVDAFAADLSSATEAINIDLNVAGDAGYSGPAGTRIVNFEYFTDFRTGSGDDVIVLSRNGAHNDRVSTNGGNDTVTIHGNTDVGSTGNDTVEMGEGDDDHLILNYGGIASQNVSFGGGTATINGSRRLSYSGAERFTITTGGGADSVTTGSADDVIRTGAEDDTVSSGAGNDLIEAGSGNDTLDGGAGADTMRGGTGDDVFIVDDAGDTVVENDGEGTDEVRTSIASYGLTANVENLTGTSTTGQTLTGNALANTITGGSGDDTLNGGGGNDTLIGNAGNDTLDGGAGADTMRGGAGDDVYIVDDEGDVVVESEGEGTDEIRTALASFSLAGFANVENLTGTSASGQTLTGNDGANTITGGAGDDTLNGGAGNDTLIGNAGNDTLDGGAGADTMRGGAGNDVFIVDDAGDTVVENDGEGTDEVRTSIASYALTANVENLTGSSATGQTLTGNDLANTITGGAGDDTLNGGAGNDTLVGNGGNDTLDGGAGADTMRGGAGNDVFIVDDAGDTVVENDGEGTDEVRTSIASYGLTANVENLTGTSTTGQTLTGNALANTITGGGGDDTLNGGAGNDTLVGNAGNDTLDGGAGADTMRGGAGNDVFIVDNEGDVVEENAGEGTDEIRTGFASFSLAGFANVENLTGTSTSGQTLTGNDLANTITGGAGNDTLNGGAGNDTLIGNGGNDTLNGGAGADTMRGGSGDDVYIVDDINDVVIEDADGGNDEVRTSVANYVLPANVEKLTYTGTAAASVRGNASNNEVAGSGGNDLFLLQDGGEDTASGGSGDDGFFMGAALSAGDSIDGGAGSNDQIAIQGNYGSASTPFVLGANNLVNVEGFVLLSSQDNRFGGGSGDPAILYSYNVKTVDANVTAGQTLIVNWSLLRSGENVTFDGSAETDGRFMIYAGQGVDNITGGSQSDGFFFADGAFTGADRIDGGGGSDNQIGLRGDYTGANAVTLQAATITNIQTIVLLSGKDTRFGAEGPDYNYDLTSHDGNVAAGARLTVNGSMLRSSESIRFDGSAETDGSFRLLGGAGNDTLIGGALDDLICGGGGADILDGRGGSDTFLYRFANDSTSSAMDRILGFDSNDVIDLSRIDANSNTPENEAFSFIGSNAFSRTAGELRLFQDANRWFVEGDVDGDGVADLVIEVQTATADQIITVNDFLL